MRLFTRQKRRFLEMAIPRRVGAPVVMVALAVATSLPAQDTTQAIRDSARVVPDTAQQNGAGAPTGQTHTVKKGDTLWDLAHQYLSDPFLWPEIYRLNTTVVEDPHWIYPGEVLKIPGGAQFVAADSMAPPFAPEPVSNVGGPTVFAQDARRRMVGDSRFGPSAAKYPHTAVRPGEFYAAPWVDREGGPAGQGRIVGSADIAGIAQASARDRIYPQDRIYITLPKGITAARGDRLMIVDRGPQLLDGGQVMIPTGIVEVERTDNGGDASTVRVVQQFGDMELGQSVLPLDRFSMSPEARPTPITLGTESQVIYVPSDVVLPSVGHYVILNATARDGVKIGDQFTLYRPRTKVNVPGGTDQVVLPEEAIALAQVVKVTDRGTTAVILDQRQPAIKDGAHARLTSRMQ
jgi:hypothetical protein